MNLFLLSSSECYGYKPYQFAFKELYEFCDGDEIIFVPYALKNWEQYTNNFSEHVSPIKVKGIHTFSNKKEMIRYDNKVIFVGGGNTFRLLKSLQVNDLLTPLQERIKDGKRYAGASAGSLVCSPTIRTTNDMPIVEPENFKALACLPFQLNCHYYSEKLSAEHMGESRDLRIAQFLEENDQRVLAMPEGAWLQINNKKIVLNGVGGGKIFEKGVEPYEIKDPNDQILQELLDES